MQTESVVHKSPPLIEMYCGMQFRPIDLKVAHFGLLWERFKDQYPNFEDADPVVDVPDVQVEPIRVPPRAWFVATSGNRLVQVQNDRFHHNWREPGSEKEYPRFDAVKAEYMRCLDLFSAFLSEHRIAPPDDPTHELSYINHVLEGNGLESIEKIDALIPGLSLHRELRGDGFRLDNLGAKASLELPDGNGRLHVMISSAKRTDTNMPLVVIQLTAKGKSKDPASWLEASHRMVLKAFKKITNPDVQANDWGMK